MYMVEMCLNLLKNSLLCIIALHWIVEDIAVAFFSV